MTTTELISAIEPVDETAPGPASAGRPASRSAAIRRGMATVYEAGTRDRTDGQSGE